MIVFNIKRLVYQLVAPFQRNRSDNTVTNRVAWLQYICSPLESINTAYLTIRKNQLSHVKLYGITSIEWLLQRDIDADITITTNSPSGVVIPSLADSLPGIIVASIADSRPGLVVPSIADIGYIGDVVNVTNASDNDSVVALIEKYRILGTNYIINNAR